MGEKRRSAATSGVDVIGLGRWGSSLVHALATAHVALPEVVAGISSSQRHRRSVRLGLPVTTLEEARLEAEILWLCVPDAAIATAVKQIVARARQIRPGQRPLQGQIVTHSSGALAAAVLAPAAKAGASIAAIHPVMTFPAHTPVPLSGVFFGVEADSAARRKLYGLVRKLGGQPFAIAGSGKAFYHVMGMLSSPLLVSLLAAAQEAGVLSGLAPSQARRLISSIAAATLNNISTQGLAKSFSGPIARGDIETIHLHLGALTAHPMLADVYRSLALYSLRVLPARGAEAVRNVLEKSTRSLKAPLIEDIKNASASGGDQIKPHA